jgi:putative endonuclease
MSELISLDFNNRDLTRSKTSLIGKTGEELAAEFLKRKGFDLVSSNFKVPIGRNRLGVQISGEIDIVALEKDVLCFIEVKTRSSDDFSTPLSAVDLRKQRQITRTARVYRKIFNLQKWKFRYDVVGIVLKNKKAPKIEIFRGFWTDEKFKKKFWMDEF